MHNSVVVSNICLFSSPPGEMIWLIFFNWVVQHPFTQKTGWFFASCQGGNVERSSTRRKLPAWNGRFASLSSSIFQSQGVTPEFPRWDPQRGFVVFSCWKILKGGQGLPHGFFCWCKTFGFSRFIWANDSDQIAKSSLQMVLILWEFSPKSP